MNKSGSKAVHSIDSSKLPIYSRVLVDEAQRRGIAVEIIDAQACLYAYSHGNERILLHDALSERTSAVALAVCDDKGLTRRILARAGLRVPGQQISDGAEADRAFLKRYDSIVVKPASGEQGHGVSVDISSEEDMRKAIDAARLEGGPILLEEFVAGADLRVLVINGEVVAAAVREPPRVTGNGHDTIESLIRAQSRRREQETEGESHIPLDAETERCVRESGWQMDQVLPEGEELQVRKTDNLHTGATIKDLTQDIHPTIREVAVEAARALNIPLVGLDFLMPDLRGEDYIIIEANENPGLAYHEPQPTVQRYMDFLFPATRGQ